MTATKKSHINISSFSNSLDKTIFPRRYLKKCNTLKEFAKPMPNTLMAPPPPPPITSLLFSIQWMGKWPGFWRDIHFSTNWSYNYILMCSYYSSDIFPLPLSSNILNAFLIVSSGSLPANETKQLINNYTITPWINFL